jgi:hypothetical protein
METGKKWFDNAHHRQAKKSFAILLLILLISGICIAATTKSPNLLSISEILKKRA